MKMSALSQFLKQHFVTKENPKPITHTRIGSKEDGIAGGSYHIPDDKYEQFMELYYNHVFVNGANEYLTEKQREIGPIAIDLDFRYDYAVTTRQHTTEHILDFINMYLEELKKVYAFVENTKIDVFVFEKPEVNRVEEKKITKDGIHIIFGLCVDRGVQMHLRKRAMEELADLWSDLPLKNTWEEVIDDGIVAGFINWQLFGSRKPNNQTYVVSMAKTYTYDSDGEFCVENIHISSDAEGLREIFPRLTVRYQGWAKHDIRPDFVGAGGVAAPKRTGSHGNISGAGAGAFMGSGPPHALFSIKSAAELSEIVGRFLDSLTTGDYELREAHSYTMILPESYYGKNSYNKWIRVGWALRNISDRLFITYLAFSARSSEFRFGGADISELWDRWLTFDVNNMQGLTKRSIMYWAKQDAYSEFMAVRRDSIEYYVDQTLNVCMQNAFTDDGKAMPSNKIAGSTDYDLASVLHQMFKGEFVCCSVQSNIWYKFTNHCWKKSDSGTELRKAISNEMRNLYMEKMHDAMVKAAEMEEGTEPRKRMEMRCNKIAEITSRLGKTTEKNNIMREARDIFHDPEFMNKLDTNPYLLCFKNGVVDFENKLFRKGYPDDYLSKSTQINYIPHDEVKHRDQITEIHDFMAKLFPVPELREYMWQHLASGMIGTAINQTLTFYLGIGSNGKSVLVEFMSKVLGDYKYDAPISLIASQRPKIGGLSPEVVALKGVRYSVIAEPEKNERIQEGAMKQLVSGLDPIQCRAPYMIEPIVFLPQFSLALCCNTLPEISSQDHGTWRRIRICKFESLFCEDPRDDDPEKPYQFKMDRNINEKFERWKEVFASMLVSKVYETGGRVYDVPYVMAASNEYRKSQDYVAEFIEDRITRGEGRVLQKREVSEEFNVWYRATYGRGAPNIKDVYNYIDKHMVKLDKVKNCWIGLGVRYDHDHLSTVDVNDSENGDASADADMDEETAVAF